MSAPPIESTIEDKDICDLSRMAHDNDESDITDAHSDGHIEFVEVIHAAEENLVLDDIQDIGDDYEQDWEDNNMPSFMEEMVDTILVSLVVVLAVIVVDGVRNHIKTEIQKWLQ